MKLTIKAVIVFLPLFLLLFLGLIYGETAGTGENEGDGGVVFKIKGVEVPLKDLRGKVVLALFGRQGARPSDDAIEALARIAKSRKGEALKSIFVNYCSKHVRGVDGIDVCADPFGELGSEFKLDCLPCLFVIDREQKLRHHGVIDYKNTGATVDYLLGAFNPYPAPEVKFELGREKVSTNSLKGRPTLLFFQKAGSGESDVELEKLRGIVKKHEGRRFRAMVVVPGEKKSEKVEKELIETSPDSDGRVARAFKVEVRPWLVVIDKFGMVRYEGEVLEKRVAPLLDSLFIESRPYAAPAATFRFKKTKFKLADFSGNVVVAAFEKSGDNASETFACEAIELAKRHEDQGLHVVLVGHPEDNSEEINGVYPATDSDGEAAGAFECENVPYFYVIDKYGKVRYRGEPDGEKARIMVKALIMEERIADDYFFKSDLPLLSVGEHVPPLEITSVKKKGREYNFYQVLTSTKYSLVIVTETG